MSHSLFIEYPHAIRLMHQADDATAAFPPIHDLRERVKEIEKLPPLPEITHEILQLQSNPYASAEQLARIIENDPVLSAQILRWSNSAMYGFRGNITSVKDAIARVLGFDIVMNLAMALTTIEPLKVQKDGPIGMRAFWSNAIFSAMLCQRLTGMVGHEHRVRPGTAYLSGLLHNLGFLLFGHLFPAEHHTLNRLLAANPDLPLSQMSEYVLGVNHTVLGLWLLEAWELPTELITSIAFQNDPDYHGDHAIYPNLVLISDRLLRAHNLSYANKDELPEALISTLGLESSNLQKIVLKLIDRKSELLSVAIQ